MGRESNSNQQKSVGEIKVENPASSKITDDTKSEETEKDEKVEKSLIKSVLETKPEDQKLDIDKEWRREKTLEEKANEALSFIAASEKGLTTASSASKFYDNVDNCEKGKSKKKKKKKKSKNRVKFAIKIMMKKMIRF